MNNYIISYYPLYRLNKKTITIVIFVFVMGSIYYFHFHDFLTITYLYEHLHTLQLCVKHHYALSVIAYLVSFIIAMSFAIPGSSLLTMTGGLLFGVWQGFFYAVIATTIGAFIVFLMSRYAIGGWIQHYHSELLSRFNNDIALNGPYYLLFIRLLGLMPFGLVNLLSGLTLISARMYCYITFIGVLPLSFMYSYFGSHFTSLLMVEEFFSYSYAMGATLFFVAKIILLPCIIKMIRCIRKKMMIVQKA